ncbi:hypothetical protein RBWH47_00023 [Rhodopirellula baltica WH47]|uniref:Uncharacterized protein n=1 Tax=Rhodopirellula baltica WH47 TaxID=991778 RepID=F2B082_RHOBT|nr:hypothetical protein RBWH47_00023 [Rhodopirellula baltica WH47]
MTAKSGVLLLEWLFDAVPYVFCRLFLAWFSVGSGYRGVSG